MSTVQRKLAPVKILPTTESLRSIFAFNESTGQLFSKKQRSYPRATSDPLGSLDSQGYLCTKAFGVKYRLHRLIWKIVTGEEPPPEIDHINGCKSDNRWANLREATHSEQQANKPIYSNNRSGFKGIHFRVTNRRGGGKWRATIQKDKKLIRLGHFDTPEEAHAAYCVAATRIHREFARTA